ncbi:glycosyltransferase family 1 protein [Microbacterium lacticum]
MSRVAVISFSPLRSDPRVLKQLPLLAAHEVTTIGHGEAPDGVAAHVRVPDGAQSWRYPRAAVIARRYRFAYENNPAVRYVREHTTPGAFDAVIANDVDAAGAACALRASRGFHLDLHEYAPEQNAELWRFRTFVAPFLRWQLRTYARRARSTSTVGHDIAQRYGREFGLNPTVVMNASAYRAISPHPTPPTIRLVHAGAALPNRRIETMIDAAGAAGRAGAPITLDVYLAPNHPHYADQLAELASGYANVTVHPAIAHRELVAKLAEYDLGVHILAPTNYNNLVALPNKLFDFVQARLGVIIGPSPEMARIVERDGLGVVAAGFAVEDLERELMRLTPDRVDAFKRASDGSARDLSAEAQSEVWREQFGRLLA